MHGLALILYKYFSPYYRQKNRNRIEMIPTKSVASTIFNSKTPIEIFHRRSPLLHYRRKSPLLPPLLASRCSAVISMRLSIALHMS